MIRIPFLDRILGRNGNGAVSLAHGTDADTTQPTEGSQLQQFFGINEVRGEITKLLGTFNPKSVGVDVRLLMRNDPDVAFGLAILKAPIVNLGYSVESEDPKIQAAVEWQIRKIYRPMATGATMAMHFGWQLLEKVWEVKDTTVQVQNQVSGVDESFNLPNAWVIHKTKAIDPRTINLLIDRDKDEWGGAEQRGRRFNNVNVNSGRVGPENLILWSFRKEEVWGQLTGFPISDHVYEPWWWKTAMNLFANRYFERRADPNFKAFADASVQKTGGRLIDGFTFLAEQLLGLRNGGVLMLPNRKDAQGNRAFDAELFMDDKRGDMFQARIDALGQQILRALWITDRAATSDGTGSLAMAEVHAESLSMMLQSIVNEWVDDVINTQVVDPFVLYNFGEKALEESKTRVVASGLSKSYRDLLLNLITQLMQAEQLTENGGKVTLAERLDAVAIAESLGLPLRSAEEMEQLSEAKEERRPEDGDPPSGRTREDDDDPLGGEDPDERAVGDELIRRGNTDPDDPGEEELSRNSDVRVAKLEDALAAHTRHVEALERKPEYTPEVMATALAIVQACANWKIPRGSAVTQLCMALSVTTKRAEEILADSGEGDKPETPEPVRTEASLTSALEVARSFKLNEISRDSACAQLQLALNINATRAEEILKKIATRIEEVEEEEEEEPEPLPEDDDTHTPDELVEEDDNAAHLEVLRQALEAGRPPEITLSQIMERIERIDQQVSSHAIPVRAQLDVSGEEEVEVVERDKRGRATKYAVRRKQ